MEILNKLFNLFNKKKVSYCILHDYEKLPDKVKSDVDMCIKVKENELDYYIYKTCLLTDSVIANKVYYGIPNLVAYFLTDNAGNRIVELDFYIDNIGISWLSIKSEVLLSKRQRYKNFFIAHPINEFIYILIKRIYKKVITEQHKIRLLELYNLYQNEINANIRKYFFEKEIKKLNRLLNTNNEKETKFLLCELRRSFYLNLFLKQSWKRLLGILFNFIRAIKRAYNPTGVYISILSPDGGGKSSVAKAISNKLLCCFQKKETFHWRPGFLPQIRTLLGKPKLENGMVVYNPHGGKRYGKIPSFFRWMYYTLDYTIGYYLKILPMKIKTTAIVMDRYYYDVIIDPVRYGFSLPGWILKLSLKFIPKPDLTIYLDNKPEELYKRKQELPIEELGRQVNAWREFMPYLPNARIVTTDKSLEDVVNEVTNLILEQRIEMTKKILKIEPDASLYLWKSNITDYLALPSKKSCRWIIPTNPIFAKNAWNLYQPYSIIGKLYKRALRFVSLMGLLKFMKSKKLNFELAGNEGDTLREHLKEIFKREDFVLAISTGTHGPFRKITALVMANDGQILGYVKIGETPLAISRVKNEANILKLLTNNYHLSEINYPKCLFDGEIAKSYVVIQSPAPFEGRSGEKYFNEKYLKVIKCLISNTMVIRKFNESQFYKNLKKSIDNYSLSYKETLQDGLKYLENTIGDKEVVFALSHGDFAPWNMIWNKNEVFIYDWESACLETPAGIDFFHFLFQTGILLKRKRGQELLSYMLNLKEYDLLKNDLNIPLLSMKSLLIIYLLDMAVKEDKPQILSRCAVERRRLIKLIVNSH